MACAGAEIADVEHYFAKCDGIADTWAVVRKEVLRYGKFKNELEDWKILNLMFQKSRLDKELIWLVSNYVWYVWDSVYVRGADVRKEQFFGFLRFKYKELQTRSPSQLENLQLFQ